MAGIGIVLNPHSKSNKKNPERAKRLGFIVGDKGSCHETQSIEDVARLAHEFKRREIEILGISGGDGTLYATLSTFVQVYGETPLPKIAFLRGGTMNNTANTLGIWGSPEKILSDVIVKYHEGKEFQMTQRNLLCINKKFYGFVFGMGIVSRFLRAYEKRPGSVAAVLLLLKYVFGVLLNTHEAKKLCELFEAKITCDEKVLPLKKYNFLFAGTIESLALGFRPLYQAAKLEDEFQMNAISATPKEILKLFPRALLGKPSPYNYCIDRNCKKMVLEFPEAMDYTIDGDFPEDPVKKIEIELGPRLDLIVG
ncbi:MAG: hypothetical protein COV43_05940 [Deltaproteobacteria bacterium CG11_big_fil_rev_8_21_14_0_20_42_23]|nr:MAG: hypothetical protein COV43_05940 [Deltaproteobacteria bacterium CG11_big_fil_rev_8_21_14_0_20_42_23]PJC65190.1 MAG: hypothetical protein CO021_00390 [Deltaproteobacteria bacterium CG_4_9_14_0_2_um_filter_42_21]